MELSKISSELIDALLKSFLDSEKVKVVMSQENWTAKTTVNIECSGFGDYLKTLLKEEKKGE